MKGEACTGRSSGDRHAIVGLAATVIVLLALSLALLGCADESAITDHVAGIWHEVGAPDQRLSITPAPHDQYKARYTRTNNALLYAYPQDDEVLIWGENTADILWTLTYDEDADQLRASGRLGKFLLERVE